MAATGVLVGRRVSCTAVTLWSSVLASAGLRKEAGLRRRRACKRGADDDDYTQCMLGQGW
jgi:hypothetical protein